MRKIAVFDGSYHAPTTTSWLMWTRTALATGQPTALSMFHLRLFHLRFQGAPIRSARDLDPSLKEAEDLFYLHLLNNGVIVPGVHTSFISAAHSAEDVDQVIDAFKRSFLAVREQRLL